MVSAGAITTVNSVLNYESLAVTTFTFSVSVADPVTSDTQNLVIDVSNVNEAPSFSQTSYSLSTSEGVVNTFDTYNYYIRQLHSYMTIIFNT